MSPKVRTSIVLAVILLALCAALFIVYRHAIFDARYNGGDFGTMAAWALGITIVIALINMFVRRFHFIKEKLGRHGDKLHQDHLVRIVQQKPWLIDVHLLTGSLGLIAVLVHAYFMWRFRNMFVIVAVMLFAWMVLAGFILKFGHPKAKKYAYIVHSQWITVLLLVLLAYVGHWNY